MENRKFTKCVADLTDNHACEALVVNAIKSFGKLDVLINNAGLGMRQVSEKFNIEPTRFWDTEPEDWCSIMDTNCKWRVFHYPHRGQTYGEPRLWKNHQHIYFRSNHGAPRICPLWTQ